MTRWGPPGSEPAHELDWLGRADHGNWPRGGFRPRRAGVPYFSRFFLFSFPFRVSYPKFEFKLEFQIVV
jgi:hypothetical protein